MGRWQLRVSVLFYLLTIFNFVKSIVFLIFTDLLDHGEDMVEVTEVGAAVGEEMATAVVARWPAAKEVVVDFEDEEDVEAVVHLTEKLTLFCLLQNFSTPSPPKKTKTTRTLIRC